MLEMLFIALISICYASPAFSDPTRICVPEYQSASCSQMERDLPEIFKCVTAPDTYTCVEKVQKEQADITNVNTNALYLAGRFFKLRPIATELIDGEPFRYKAIALVRKTSSIQSAKDLKNASSCHADVRDYASWHIPMAKLMFNNIMPADCEDGDLGAAQDFFNNSCVPGEWSSDPMVDKGLKTRYSKLCSGCKNPSTCANDDAYAGEEGVMGCLSDGAADVAFTKLAALREHLAKNPAFADVAEILCFEGGRKSVLDPSPCVWGVHPTNSYVTRLSDIGEDKDALEALLKIQSSYTNRKVSIPEWYHKTFLSHPKVTGLRKTEDDKTHYIYYLGDFIHSIRKPRRACRSTRAHLALICVSSDEEMSRCLELVRSSYVLGLWPDIRCGKASSKFSCMLSVREDKSHMVILDGAELYKAGRYYGLKPIASEFYKNPEDTYYAVAVLRNISDIKHMHQLRGLRSCHTGMGHPAGWVIPTGFLVSEGLLPRGDTCNRIGAMAEFFEGGSCAPGANDTRYNLGRVRTDDLCRHCVGDEAGKYHCARNTKERYYDFAGALRCLAEGKGDVAFVKHTTVSEYTDGSTQLGWAKYLQSSDFKLLCGQGGVENITNYEECNIGKVPSHYVAVRSNLLELRRLQVARLLADISQFFSNDTSIFRLFRPRNHQDDFFKDSAAGLKITNPEDTYEKALGKEFLDACISTDAKVCIH